MLRKIGLFVLVSIISVGTFYQPVVLAANSSPLLNGQHHYYTVQMRNDDQAITYAKIVFQNGDSETNRKTVEFSLPKGVTASNLSVQQILPKKTVPTGCKTYESYQEWSSRTGESFAPTTTQQSRYNLSKLCLEQNDSSAYDEDYDFVTNSSNDAYNTYYYYSRYQNDNDFEYSDLTINEKDGKYTINLSTEIKPKKQGAILVSYTSKDYVSGILGRFTYDYRTLATDEMINAATASISFDEGLYSRTAKQERADSKSSSSGILEGASADSASSSYESDSLDTLQYSVGTGGTETKTQSKMLPGDVMSVTGVYATTPVVLFGKEILISLIVAALIGVGIWRLVVYREKHRKVLTKKDFATNHTESSVSWDDAPKVFQQETESLAELTIGRMIAVSAVSIGCTALILFAVATVGSVMSSGNSYYNSYNSIFYMYVPAFAIAIIVYGLFISPMVYVLRFGVRPAFIWSLIQVSFGIVGLIIALGIALNINNNNSTINNSPSYPDYSGTLKNTAD